MTPQTRMARAILVSAIGLLCAGVFVLAPHLRAAPQ